MTQTYIIKGMTCNGCRTSVEKTLNEMSSISHAAVNLEKEEAVIEASTHITSNELQEALPEKYTVLEKKSSEQILEPNPKSSGVFKNSVSAFAKAETPSKFKQLKPLFLILLYITLASILLNYKDGNWQSSMLDFMGLFYIVFSFFKMLDLKGFAQSFQMYDPLAKRVPFYAKVYPFVETILGLLFLMRLHVEFALITTIIVLGITTIGVTKTLLDKKAIQCACLGTALKLPMTEATFIENAIMIAMALAMLFSAL